MATGYVGKQSPAAAASVSAINDIEEHVLRLLDEIAADQALHADPRWLATGRTAIEQGFMAVARSIIKPARVEIVSGEAESGWLVERGDEDAPFYYAPVMHGPQWTSLPEKALRFAREDDAVAMAGALAIECRAVECAWGTP